MRSLDQIEPRTPISSAPYFINAPGSYYLTQNLTVNAGHAIEISAPFNASGVTLDLNGFTISSTAPNISGTAILITASRNVTIRNGSIRSGVTRSGSNFTGTGFVNGITISGEVNNVVVSHVSVGGLLGDGINLGVGDSSTVAESCTVRIAGGSGILASIVKNSVARECGGTAIFGINVENCSGYSTGMGHGIQATNVTNSDGSSFSGGNGIVASSAQNCRGSSFGGAGIGISTQTALNCTGSSNLSYGINCDVAGNCKGTGGGPGAGIFGNTISHSYGISATGNGLDGYQVSNSYGISNGGGGAGVYAFVATSCRGVGATGGRGVRFEQIGAMCYGVVVGGASSSVLGAGANGPVNLPP